MDFYKKVLDSMDRVSDSNERLAEYLDGVLNAKGLESFVSVTPHKDGYRLQIAGKYSPLYVDVYLDGEDLVLGGSKIGNMTASNIKEMATFLGIPEKEVGEKANRFASVIRYLIAHNHRPVDELGEVTDSARVKDDEDVSGEVAEKVEEVFADFAAQAPEDRGVRHIDLVAYGTPITLRFQTAEKNKDRLDVYAAVDGDVDDEASRQYVGSDSLNNKGRAVVKALMSGVLADLAGKAAVKEAGEEKKAAEEAGAFDADVLYEKIKEMHEDLQNIPAGAKQEIMAEVENADHEVKLMFTPGEAEGSVAFIVDVDGKPNQIGEYPISNKMLPYFAVSDLLRQADKILGISVADSCGEIKDDEAKGKDALGVEADIMRMMEDFRTGSKDARVLEYDNLEGHNVRLTVIPSKDGKRMTVYATIDGGVPAFIAEQLIDAPLASAKVLNSLYDKILPVGDSARVKDDEHAAQESALEPLSDAVNAMRADRSIKTKVANVDYLGSDVSFILTRKVDKDKGLVHVYVRNGKGAPMTFVASYDLDGVGVADRMFHAGLKELGIEDACNKKKGSVNDGVSYEVEDMDRLRAAVGDTYVLEEFLRWESDDDVNAFIRDLSRTVFGGAEEIEDSKCKNAVSDAGACSIECIQGRVGRILAGEAAGPNRRSSYAVRSFGKDKTLASVTIKGAMNGDEVTGLDVSYIYTTPLFSVVVDEHYDIPAGDAPEKELGEKIDTRMDELGEIAVDLYEGKIDEAKARELIGSPVEIDRDVVPSSINMVRDAVASSPEEVEIRVKSVISEGNTGRAFISRVYGGDILGKAILKAVKAHKPGYDKGVEVTFSFSTPSMDVSKVEYFDIPETEKPHVDLGKAISDRMDEMGRAVLHAYDGIIEMDEMKAILGDDSLKIEEVTDSADPKAAELIASLEADGSAENVARVAKEWADTFGFKTMKGSDGKELMAFSYVNGESDAKPTQYSYKQHAWTRIQ